MTSSAESPTAVAADPPESPESAAPAPADASAAPTQRPPLRVFLTILHLAAFGIGGWLVLSLLFSVLGAGLGLILLLGLGAIVLVGLVYAMFGVAWFEVERVSGLYRLDDVPGLRWSPQRRPDFKGWFGSLGRQIVDGRMWRALANFTVAAIAGSLVLLLFQGLIWSVVAVFAPYSPSSWVMSRLGGLSGAWPPVLAILGVLFSTAGIVGLALLHRAIAVAIIRAGTREEQLTRQAQVSARQREGAVRAADVERTRIERDLHDGVQPRLVSVGMTLGLARQKIDDDPEEAKSLIAEAHTSTKAAITELRQLARGIHASVLDDRGLDAALSALAGRSHIPVQLDVRLQGRCSREAETAVYFAIAESLTNAAKHSRASECRVIVRLRDEGTLWARVEDNGIGGARIVPGGGLDGIVNRVTAAGGTTRLDSPQGGPTSLEVSVPCAS